MPVRETLEWLGHHDLQAHGRHGPRFGPQHLVPHNGLAVRATWIRDRRRDPTNIDEILVLLPSEWRNDGRPPAGVRPGRTYRRVRCGV